MGCEDPSIARDPWHDVVGQRRALPIAATLNAARTAAKAAGVTRLGDVSGLAPFGIPVFQATRPLGRLLSVSQGKGLTPRAAMVSALLEAVELDCAERISPCASLRRLDQLDDSTRRLWRGDGRGPLTIRLDPATPRGWLDGRDMMSGSTIKIPWDLVSLDTAGPLPADVRLSSVGLATGNSVTEACVGAVAELLEHDLQAELPELGPRARRAREVDLDSIDDPLARRVIARVRAGGCTLRAWSIGQDAGIAAFACALIDSDTSRTMLPPAGGTGCHPDRAIAFLRAALEAVQSRITLIAGAREDIVADDYRDAATRTLNLVLGGLSFGPGPLCWSSVPHHPSLDGEGALASLLAVAARRSPLPILLYTHDRPHPVLNVVRAIGPGLRDLGRRPAVPAAVRAAPSVRITSSNRRPILFVGPSLHRRAIPDSIEARPPAVCGDLAALLADPPPAVGLIDGCFETAPTVWHKEILDLMGQGVPVAGAASLGALRAAELHMFGMIGIGEIFAAFASGELARDDAVLLSHAPAELGWMPLTVALVDAEMALARAALDPPERRQLQRIVRRADFRTRTWRACLDAYHARVGRPASACEAQLEGLATAKHDDALALVVALADGLARPRPVPRLPMTALYRLMLGNAIPLPPATRLPKVARASPA